MAEVVWTEPAVSDLDAIADYIALENPDAAASLVRRVLARTAQLAEHPRSGAIVAELPGRKYRQIIEPPCRLIYRPEKARIFIVLVVRGERLLGPRRLARRAKAVRR